MVTFDEEDFIRRKKYGSQSQDLRGKLAKEFVQVIDTKKPLIHPTLPPNSQTPPGYTRKKRRISEKTTYYCAKERQTFTKGPLSFTAVYVKNNHGERWVNGNPTEGANDAELIEQAVTSFAGKTTSLSVSMTSADFSEFGLAAIADIAKSVDTLGSLKKDWSALGSDLATSNVSMRAYGKSSSSLRATWFAKIKTLVIDTLGTPKEMTVEAFCKAVGANSDVKPAVTKVSYNSKEVVFTFSKETTKEEIDKFLAPCKEKFKVQTEEEKYRRNISGANSIYISYKNQEDKWVVFWTKAKGLVISKGSANPY